MPQFCANLSMMYNEVGFLDRFAEAAADGFGAVEFLFPYEHPAAILRQRLDSNGLRQVLFNAPPGDWAAGERGIACLPGRQTEFREGIHRALDYAHALDCRMVHVMAGIAPAGSHWMTLGAIYAANLAWAAEQAVAAGVRLLIEPINHRDMPGYLLHTLGQGAAIVQAIGVERLALQFDIYHCQVTEGDITKRMETYFPLIGHMQLADVPGRHEPGSGEIGWDYVLRRIDALGYSGFVGCEYRPAGETRAGLAWRQRYAERA
jgi:hydroxypyruvate isomerase